MDLLSATLHRHLTKCHQLQPNALGRMWSGIRLRRICFARVLRSAWSCPHQTGHTAGWW